MRKPPRISWLIALWAMIGALLTAGCGAPGGGGESETLKIGVPLALTGPIAAQAEEMVNGYKLYLKQHDDRLGGVPVSLHFEDTEADPSVVIAKTRKLITQDQVHLIGGGALALESLAIIDVAVSNDIAFVTPISSADDLTQRKLEPVFARPNMTSSQPNLYFGEWAAKEAGYKKVAIIAQDYAYGWESAGGFQYGFEKSGGEVVQKIWMPLDTTDPAPFVRQLRTDVDAIYAILVGAHVPRFVKAYEQFGLKEKVPLIGGPDMGDEDALRAMGDEEVGLVTAHEYSASLPTAQQFIRDYRAEYNATPSYWAESTYTTAHFLDEAIKKVREEQDLGEGELASWVRDNAEAFIKAVVSIELEDTPRGKIRFDEYHNAVNDIYVFRVTKPDTTEAIAKFEGAGQFWKETPQEFLQHPVFSRSFP